MAWRNREPNQTFEPSELLYYRVPYFNEFGHVDAAHIRFPDTSVNRALYSSPEHVLLSKYPKFVQYKVAQFAVSDIPATTRSGDGRAFDVSIFHDPVRPPEEPEENYAHCEIRAFETGKRTNKLPAAAEKRVRELIGSRMTRAL